MHPSRFPLTFLFLHTEGFCALLYLLVCGGGGTGDNLDQLAGNDGLSGSVEENLVLVDHLTGVLGGVVHSVATGRLLAGVALSQTPEDGVGESVLAQVGEELLVGLEGGDVLGCHDGLLGVSIDGVRLVARGVDELVVEDLDLGVVGRERDDLVGNGLGLSEGGDVLSNTSEGQLDVLGLGSLQLGLALLAQDDELVCVGLLGVEAADVTGKTGVDTTTEALVGGADDEQGLLALGLEGLGLGLVEDLLGDLTVRLGLGHGALGAGELGGGDDLHGLGDLLNVADGLEAALDFSESRIAGGGIGGGCDGAVPGDGRRDILACYTG